MNNFRFYEEGDAATLVIPRHSTFRKNLDWLDENFPREVILKRKSINANVLMKNRVTDFNHFVIL